MIVTSWQFTQFALRAYVNFNTQFNRKITKDFSGTVQIGVCAE